jgi:hypothetical protein
VGNAGSLTRIAVALASRELSSQCISYLAASLKASKKSVYFLVISVRGSAHDFSLSI